MEKAWKRILICGLLAAGLWTAGLVRDRQFLNRQLIRLHVIANSDREEDQRIKLQVRDAVLDSLREGLEGIGDVEQAKAYLRENLPKIQSVANRTLKLAGVDAQAVVTLGKETYDTREYDTFSLPAGVYESLRILIGNAQGRNWWCVAFPSLCLSATTEDFVQTAQTAGMSGALTETLSGEDGHQIRFFLLDALGKAEKAIFAGK